VIGKGIALKAFIFPHAIETLNPHRSRLLFFDCLDKSPLSRHIDDCEE
jgi:hypothetical protein